MADKPVYGGQSGSSAAMKRVKASKQRQKNKIEKPTAISNVLGPLGGPVSKPVDPMSLITPDGRTPKLPKDTPAYGGQTANYAAAQASFDANNSVPADDGGMAALEQMLKSQMGSKGMSDKEIAALISQSVGGTFNPQIKALEQEMGRAKGRAKTARADLKALYADLSGYYNQQGDRSSARYGVSQKGAQARTQGLKNAITSDYTERLKEQVDMYKQLGIEAAAPSATEGQYADQASQLGTADIMGTAEQQALATEQRGDQTYWDEGAAIAQTEGAEQQTNVITQLQDFLNTQGASVAGLKGQKNAAYSQAMLEAKQKRADQANQQQNQIWSRMLALAKLKQSAAKSGGSGSDRTPAKGLAGVASYLGSQRLANEFQTSMQQATTWNQSPQAKQYYGGEVPNTPEEMAQVIRDNAANRGLSPDDQLKLWQAALVYYNKLQ